jgi:hypothetical protein
LKGKTRIRRSVRAISPVISVLLMIAIAVAASLIAYAWIMGYIGGTTTKVGRAIQIQSLGKDPDNENYLLVYVQNVGQGAVEFDPGSCAYVNDLLGTIGDVAPNPLAEGKTATIRVDLSGMSIDVDELIKVKVVTKDGTFSEAKSTVPLSDMSSTYVLTLNVSPTDGGTVAQVPVPPYAPGTSVTLTANPNAGWIFAGWSGDLTGSINPETIVMNGYKTVTAMFTQTTAVLDHFDFTVSSPQTAGTAFGITITAKDASDNTVTSYTGINTLTVSSGTISPTSTTAFTAGVWTGDVTLFTSGSGITIGTTGDGKTGTSDDITVTAGSGTFGNTNTGIYTRSISDYIRGSPYVAPATGTAQSISAYVSVTSTSRHIKAAIYTTAGTLIGSTDEITRLSGGAQWVTMPFSGTKPSLTAGTTYILVVWADSSWSSSVDLYYSGTSTDAGRYLSRSYGTWPSTPSFTNDNYQYCVYCTYSIP